MTVELIEFEADWCGPCKQQAPIIDELDEDRDDVTVSRVDVDDNPDLANKYNVRSIPAVVIESDNGVEKRFDGVTQRDAIESVIDSVQADAPL